MIAAFLTGGVGGDDDDVRHGKLLSW